MSPKKLAQHYLRFWTTGSNGAELSDNAPREFWQFVLCLPPSTDRQVIYKALKSTASPSDNLDCPDVPSMLRWLADNPGLVERADNLLSGKTPPKNLSTLLRNTYLADIQTARVLVQNFLNAEIEKFK